MTGRSFFGRVRLFRAEKMATIALLYGGGPEDDLRAAGACAIFRDAADLLDRYYQLPLAG